jgi:DNA-binding SARP family transcriptional activator/tetratricopeptide (TPR) repeat protein
VVGAEFGLLGTVEAWVDGVPLQLGHARQRCVLAALLVEPRHVLPVDQLVHRVWGENPPRQGLSTLYGYVYRLRQVLTPAGVDLQRCQGGYRLMIDPAAVDLHRFQRLVATGGDDRGRLAAVEEALGLWRGEALAGLDTPWVNALRRTLDQQRLTAELDRYDLALRLGKDSDLLADMYVLAQANQLDERLAGQLMLALYRAGRPAAALEHYNLVREHLVTGLGTEPSPALRQLHQRILNADPTLGRDDEPASSEVVAWRQLPMDIAEFTGRQRELAQLDALVDADAPDQPTAVVISAIEGMAGVGKTRLTVHLAHQLINKQRYDDVQLWTDLRGFDADHPPADPSDVLENFLRLLGVPGDNIPTDLESRAALYRDRLAGKKALILLDNAAREEQVRPLLPGRPGCLVLITSRRSMSGLDGAHMMRLDVLSPKKAVELMARIATDGRIPAQPQAAARVADLCGHLPIALSLAARRLRARPQWTVDDLVNRLTASDGLNNTFELSYRAIPADQQRLFRLLGLHVGNDVTAASAAALTGWPLPHAEDVLEALLDEHLLQQEITDRYRFHDLIRPYARHLAEAEETEEDRTRAVHRLLCWYLHTAEAARNVLDPHRTRVIDLEPLPADCTVPEFGDYDQALAWYEEERATLVAVVRAASPLGLATVAWQLSWVMMSLFYRRSYWDDWITTFRIALTATQTLGERRAEGIIWRGLGVAYGDLRRFDTAIDCYQRAQTLFEEVGDVHAQGWNLNNLGVIHVDLGNLATAEHCFQQALSLLRETGDQQGEGFCLNNLGDTSRRLGNTTAAVTYLTEALAIQRQREDHVGLQFTLTTLGDLHQDAEQYDTALDYYQRALATSRQLDDQRTAARTLANLAKIHHALGDTPAAADHWRQAHAVFTELGDPQAEDIAKELERSPDSPE